MFRFFLSLIFFVVVGRWVYAEAKLAAPGLIPLIDRGLQVVQIPTHDRWSMQAIESCAAELTTIVSEAQASTEE